ALRAGSAAREDGQIPRLVPRAAPAAARLAVSACSRLLPRKTTVGALEPATALRRIDPRVGAAAISDAHVFQERKSHGLSNCYFFCSRCYGNFVHCYPCLSNLQVQS